MIGIVFVYLSTVPKLILCYLTGHDEFAVESCQFWRIQQDSFPQLKVSGVIR